VATEIRDDPGASGDGVPSTYPAIEAQGIQVTRGKKTILRGITLEAGAGEVVGVLGPSGAGKSTLFRALVGELALDAGAVFLSGRDVSAWPLWRRAREGLGYVPQTPSVLWDLTVGENLRVYHRVVYGGAWPSRPLAGEEEAVVLLARKVDLGDRFDVRAGDLSGGERRRLEIARALTRPPRVLVCDAPFAGVDPRQAGRIGDMLGDLASTSGMTVLLADHHVAEALRICTRAVLLLDGAIAADEGPDAFREHPLVVGRYLGSWTRTLPPPRL
jgi:lipopolysaccharide export system ATP-binding protein